MTETTDSDRPSDAIIAWASLLIQKKRLSWARVGSNHANRVFRLDDGGSGAFLKIGPRLRREYDKFRWLYGRLPCPRPIGFTIDSSNDALLSEAIPGEDLASLCVSLPPQTIIARFAAALRVLHSADIADLPFGGGGSVLVHGDACLPNFLYHESTLTGYIDIGDMAAGEPETDLAAAVWSLQYNLGPGFGAAFLREYGWREASEEEAERLRLLY